MDADAYPPCEPSQTATTPFPAPTQDVPAPTRAAIEAAFLIHPPDSPALARLWRRIAPGGRPAPCGLHGVEIRKKRAEGWGALLFALVWTVISTFFAAMALLSFFMESDGSGEASPAVFLMLAFPAAGLFLLKGTLATVRSRVAVFVAGDRLWTGTRRIRRHGWREISRDAIAGLAWRRPFLPRDAAGRPAAPVDDWGLWLKPRDPKDEPVDLYDLARDSTAKTVGAWTWLGERIAAWAGVDFDAYRPNAWESFADADWDGELPPRFSALAPDSPALAQAWRELAPENETPPPPGSFGLVYHGAEGSEGGRLAGVSVALFAFCLLLALGFAGGHIAATKTSTLVFAWAFGGVLALAALLAGVTAVSKRFRRTLFVFEPERFVRLSRLGPWRRTLVLPRGEIAEVVYGCPPDDPMEWFLRILPRDGGPVELFRGLRVDEDALPPQARWLGGRIAQWANAPYNDTLPPIDLDP